MYLNTNGIENSIRIAVEDADLTYTLGFYPAQESKDRDLHSLKVKVARGGVSVRYRENYSASLTPAKAHGRPTNDRPTMDQLLNDPLNATQLGLFAERRPSGAPGFLPGARFRGPSRCAAGTSEYFLGGATQHFILCRGFKIGPDDREEDRDSRRNNSPRVWRNHLWLRLPLHWRRPVESCTSWRRTKLLALPGH